MALIQSAISEVIGKSGSGQADYIGKATQGSAILSKIAGNRDGYLFSAECYFSHSVKPGEEELNVIENDSSFMSTLADLLENDKNRFTGLPV